jgi:hypothetical protein
MLSLSDIYQKLTTDARITEYSIYEQLFQGDHFQAFSIKSKDFKNDYARLRYVVCNFAGLVSKVIADMLFGEPITIKDKDNQDWVDTLVFENNLHTLFYEHSVANSFFGDNLFKIRVQDNKILIEDTPPMLYIPELAPGNTRAKPKAINLAWVHSIGDTKYLVVERHEPPFVKTEAGQILDAKTGKVQSIDLKAFNELAGTSYEKEVDTKIKRFLIKHIPNPKPRGHFGLSDYVDLKPLLFSLNNRMTKTDNILDKHSDPILAVPPGVLDEDGKVKKEAFNMFEVTEEGQKPEYIVWNANLDNAMKQIDKMVEFLFMFSETSPDALGLGKEGQAESGRALKMRLLRTIAKRNRKKLYYDASIKDLIFTAELLAKANNYKISDDINVSLKNPIPPEIIWQDGVANDEVERTDIMVKKVESGLISEKRAIIELEGVKEDEADEIIKEISEEKKQKAADFTSFIDKKGGGNPDDNKENPPEK